MGFEQIPNIPIEPSKEQPPYPGWILENGIWRDPTKEEDTELTENKEDKDIKEEKTDKKLRSLEQELEELDSKEYINPDGIKRKEKLEIEYVELNKQIKETPGGKENASSIDKTKEKEKGEKKSEEEQKKEKLEIELTERYYDELEKIKQMSDNNKNLKAKKCFELINDWKDLGYLDNYKGIQEIFSELNKSKPSIFLYNWKKAETIDEVAVAMASNYKEWNIEDKKKLKIMKSFVKKQSKEKNFWYGSDDKDETLKNISQILALQDIPFKNNIDMIIKDIKNPNIKSKMIEEIADIEKESIEEKKELLKEVKDKVAKEKIPSEAKVKEQLKEMGASSAIEKILQDPEALSKIFYEASEISKNPEVQEKFQELKNTIEKVTKEKGEIPEAVAKAKKHIEKEESPWKTAFGVAGSGILLFLVLFLLAELKGAEVLSGQAEGKKKK